MPAQRDHQHRERDPKVVGKIPVIEAHLQEKYIVAVIDLPAGTIPGIDVNGTVGLRFISPEHLLTFFEHLMRAASEVWPESEWIREYHRPE